VTPTAKTLEERRALVERWQRILQLLDYELTVENLDFLHLKELSGSEETLAYLVTNPSRNHVTVSFLEDQEDRLGDNYVACHEMIHVPLDLLFRPVRDLLDTYVHDDAARELFLKQIKDNWEATADKFARAFLAVEKEATKPEA
jgi:hypothetical protein